MTVSTHEDLVPRDDGRVWNFSAGPAALPRAVLERAQSELLNFGGCGASVMEISHRGETFAAVAARAEASIRRLLSIPDYYRVLFLQGGATGQFSAVPLNFSRRGSAAAYIDTGIWSRKAEAEAASYLDAVRVASAEPSRYTEMARLSEIDWPKNCAYVHVTPNETIGGLEFYDLPSDVGELPVVADFSSTLLSRPIDVTRYGVIYAGAQKNIGPAGVVVVIVREDLLDAARDDTPTIWNWGVQSEHGSMVATPPTFSWYLAGLVFEWLESQGGLEVMANVNQRKAGKLYHFIDSSEFFRNPIDPSVRSWMNVPFLLADAQLDGVFLRGAADAGFQGLAGHRSVGGMRASLYNAVPEAAVDALIEFMADFEQRHA
ncbi:MAG: 3-phosphoserine/phosphohydroxythreonine transaminase [Thioalkalivibrionaceae bacterium]